MRNVIDNLLNKIKTIVLNQVIYLDSAAFCFKKHDVEAERCYSFSKLNNILDEDKTHKSIVTILSRNCYHEHVQWYPITKKSDLLKVVKLQSQHSILPVLFIIGKVFNGQTPVTYYHLNDLSTKVNSWLMVPETSLLSQSFLAETLVSYQTLLPVNTVFIAKGVSGSSSTLKGGIIQSDQQFALSTGVVLTHRITLTPSEHADILNLQLKRLYKIPLAGLFSKKKLSSTGFTKLFSTLVLPICVVVTVYLLLAVQISSYFAQHTKSELTAATKEANEVLNQYNQINSMIKRYQLVADKVPVHTELLSVWQVLAPLYQSGVIINSVRQNHQQITLQFSAPSASQSLQLLIQQPSVTNASFVGPVNRRGNFDTATVLFELKPIADIDLNEHSVAQKTNLNELSVNDKSLAVEAI
ncbi:hypothetical protein ACRN9G_07465 [Shewanella frigidimarina]|uniref:hypothetical protein n=1 Tax=Shewanella frigidimarina TaxID=56812 RepID=UPI003D7A551B